MRAKSKEHAADKVFVRRIFIPPPLSRAIPPPQIARCRHAAFAGDRLFKRENISNTEMSLTANIITNFFLVIAMALYVFLRYMLFRYAKERAVRQS